MDALPPPEDYWLGATIVVNGATFRLVFDNGKRVWLRI